MNPGRAPPSWWGRRRWVWRAAGVGRLSINPAPAPRERARLSSAACGQGSTSFPEGPQLLAAQGHRGNEGTAGWLRIPGQAQGSEGEALCSGTVLGGDNWGEGVTSGNAKTSFSSTTQLLAAAFLLPWSARGSSPLPHCTRCSPLTALAAGTWASSGPRLCPAFPSPYQTLYHCGERQAMLRY